MDSCTNQGGSYGAMKEDPEKLINLVDKYVKVHTVKNCSYVGFVHSFDPVTHSVLLSIPREETYQTTLIPGHAILDVTEEVLITDIQPPRRKQTLINTTEDILKRKNQLLSWFKSNLLPVSEVEDKIVIGNVSILPPYNTLDVYTENPIVAIQIKKILERMPADFSL